jgi:hypothetical protein
VKNNISNEIMIDDDPTCEQGDQIGRIFALWVVVLGALGISSKITEVITQIVGLLFTAVKVMH